MNYRSAMDDKHIELNRYRNVLAYDETRVPLRTARDHDYINGNFLDIPIDDAQGLVYKYIATQGPMGHTCEDFWRMMWEQKTTLIAMTTHLIEGGKVTCCQADPCTYS